MFSIVKSFLTYFLFFVVSLVSQLSKYIFNLFLNLFLSMYRPCLVQTSVHCLSQNILQLPPEYKRHKYPTEPPSFYLFPPNWSFALQSVNSLMNCSMLETQIPCHISHGYLTFGSNSVMTDPKKKKKKRRKRLTNYLLITLCMSRGIPSDSSS